MHIVIIGNGISGVSCARWIRKLSDHQITLIASESEYFYSRTALMYVFMGHIRTKDLEPYPRDFWRSNKISLKLAHVNSIDTSGKLLYLNSGEVISYDKLVLALGSKSNKFGWPGQDLPRVSGLYHLSDLQNMEFYAPSIQRAVIVGGGLIGIEMAEMFLSRGIEVCMLVREQEYWDNVLPSEEAAMISDHVRKHGIDLRLGTNLKEIRDENGELRSVITMETDEEIVCQYVGLTPGVRPNIDLLSTTTIETDRGILVNEFLETNTPDIYAIGDCAQLKKPQAGRGAIEAVWYTGRIMGETLAYNLCGSRQAYDPGIWYNSAKFLDIEYQVYGYVPNHFVAGIRSFFWKDIKGEKSLRIVYEENTRSVLGFNVLGLRYRQEVCHKWISEKTVVEKVMANLSLAHFDPEFNSNPSFEIYHSFCNDSDIRTPEYIKHNAESTAVFLNSRT